MEQSLEDAAATKLGVFSNLVVYFPPRNCKQEICGKVARISGE
jgi:hypothetical protein